jgi:DNA-binding transcriptional ArsR family regulator
MDATLDITPLPATDRSDRELARLMAPRFKVLGDENRLTLVLLLAERPRTVKELQEASGLSQTLVSHHLAPLRELELVSVEARGRSNVYTLCCEELGPPVRWLATLAAMTPAGADACCATTPVAVGVES